MPSTVVSIIHKQPAASLTPGVDLTGDVRKTATSIAALLDGIAGGLVDAYLTVSQSATAATPATGQVYIASGSGAVTATINGVAISVTWASSDANTATLLANAINASTSALVKGIVTASASGKVVTITSCSASKTANSITLAASGTGVTASAARLTGGSGNDVALTTSGAPATMQAKFSTVRASQMAGAFLLLRTV